MLGHLFRKLRPIDLAATAAVVALAGYFGFMWMPWPQPGASFRLPGPQGETVAVQLPELAKIPPLDSAAACAKLATHNARARNLNPSSFGEDDDEYKRTIFATAEAGCGGGERAFAFYDELGEVLASGESRRDADQLIAAMREALGSAPSARQAAVNLRGLNRRLSPIADALQAPEFYLIGAEVMAAHLIYCTGESAAACLAETHAQRGQNLADAGRWRADADLLRAAIAAYREALRDVADGSKDWVELHTLIGSALAQLSEKVDDRAKRTLLLQAIQEYNLAGQAVDRSDEATWAMINQNVCSIRQPYAALDKDRRGTRLAIEKCEKAGAYYRAQGEKSNEAAAHHNMAHAYARLAEWDEDEAAAAQAVEHARHAAALYGNDSAAMSQAFAQMYLAQALLDAADFVRRRKDAGDVQALIKEARQSLDAAEPVLRSAQAKQYLERLEDTRRRLAAR